MNFEKWRPSDSSNFTAAGGEYCSGQKTSLAARERAMMIRKQNCNTQRARRKERSSSDSTEENGNHTERNQHRPFHSPPNIGVGQEIGKILNKGIPWNRDEMKEVM